MEDIVGKTGDFFFLTYIWSAFSLEAHYLLVVSDFCTVKCLSRYNKLTL